MRAPREFLCIKLELTLDLPIGQRRPWHKPHVGRISLKWKKISYSKIFVIQWIWRFISMYSFFMCVDIIRANGHKPWLWTTSPVCSSWLFFFFFFDKYVARDLFFEPIVSSILIFNLTLPCHRLIRPHFFFYYYLITCWTFIWQLKNHIIRLELGFFLPLCQYTCCVMISNS